MPKNPSPRAISAEPILFVCPAPIPRVAPSLTTQMALLLMCFTIFSPKLRSLSSSAEGLVSVTHISATTSTVLLSASCTSSPPVMDTIFYSVSSVGVISTSSSRRFFLVHSIPRASGEKCGAITISRKISFIIVAVCASISQLVATMPPYMLISYNS